MNPQHFPNLAGHPDPDPIVIAELEAAGLLVYKLGQMQVDGEVKAHVIGSAGGPLGGLWSFERRWYYWSCNGPGIPPDVAERLHAEYGREVRVDGHCAALSPREVFFGFAVGSYHVDTPRGLKALADVIWAIAPKPEPMTTGGAA